MQNSSWIALVRLIPAALHNQLALVTTIGLEIAVQDVFRLEEEYMVVRGRLAGTTDSGRIFLVPYDQVNFIGLQKMLKEQEIEALFNGTYGAAEPTTATEVAEVDEPPEADSPVEPPGELAAPALSRAPAPNPKKPPSRQLLLERVRARLAAAGKSKAPGISR
jgi:hypothetical protein